MIQSTQRWPRNSDAWGWDEDQDDIVIDTEHASREVDPEEDGVVPASGEAKLSYLWINVWCVKKEELPVVKRNPNDDDLTEYSVLPQHLNCCVSLLIPMRPKKSFAKFVSEEKPCRKWKWTTHLQTPASSVISIIVSLLLLTFIPWKLKICQIISKKS